MMSFVNGILILCLLYAAVDSVKALPVASSTAGTCDLLPPESITVPDADNTSITVQWARPTSNISEAAAEEGSRVCDHNDDGVFYEIQYWRVNRNKTFENVRVNLTQTKHQLKMPMVKPRKYYSVKVRLCQGVLCGVWSDTVTHGAVDGVSDKPTNLKLGKKTSNCITIEWEPPTNPNGQIIRYMISYKKIDSNNPNNVLQSLYIDPNITNTTLPHLKEDTRYQIWVIAGTRVGMGSPVTVFAKTKEKDAEVVHIVVGVMGAAVVALLSVTIVIAAIKRKRNTRQNDVVHEVRARRYGSVLSTDTNDNGPLCESPSATSIDIDQLTFDKHLMGNHKGQYQIRKGKFMSLARNQHKATQVAIKTCSATCDIDTKRKTQNESEVLKLLGEHCHVVQLMGICKSQGSFHEVLEYCPGGSLYDFLRENNNKLEDAYEMLLGMAIDIAEAMQFIGQHKIVHRDLGTENILIGSSNLIKISAFGHAMIPGKAPLEIPELTNWRSKSVESLCGRIFTIHSDVWSFGIILWELLTPGHTPYVDMSLTQTKRFLSLRNRLQRQKHWHENIYQVMLQCWNVVPGSRPSFDHLASTLTGIRNKKQFYHNFAAEAVQHDSINMEEYDLVNSQELDDYPDDYDLEQ